MVIKNVGHNTTTTNTDIDGFINTCPYLKGKCHKTSSSDMIPKLTKLKPYIIVNVDKSYESGSHWLAIALHAHCSLVYDSFGRKTEDLIEDVLLAAQDTDHDAEQDVYESNCGQRCLAFLILFDMYGFDIAKML